jgi:hypothetical protein
VRADDLGGGRRAIFRGRDLDDGLVGKGAGVTGVGVYPLSGDARRYFRGRGLSLFGADSSELSSEARFGLRCSAGR